MLSKGYMRSLSHLALARAFLISSTRVEEEDLIKDGLVPRATIDEIKAYREMISNRIGNFLGNIYQTISSEERGTIRRINNNTVDKAMQLIYKQLVDMDYIAIYLLEYLYKADKVKDGIKSLIDTEELKEMKSLVEKTYVGEIRDKKYISKFEHIALVKKITLETS